MPRRKNNPLCELNAQEHATLQQISRSQTVPAAEVCRTRLLWLVAQGHAYQEAACAVGRRSGDAVATLVARFNHEGLAALAPHHGGRRKTLYFLCRFILVMFTCYCLISPTRCAAQNELPAVLRSAEKSEARIHSGRLHVSTRQTYIPPPPEEDRRLISDPKQAELAIFKHKIWPKLITQEEEFLFNGDALLTYGTREPSGKFRFRYGKKDTRVTHWINGVSGNNPIYVSVKQPEWPSYWPNTLWLGRFWEQTNRWIRQGKYKVGSISERSSSGAVAILLLSYTTNKPDFKVWIDPGRGFILTRYQYIERATQHISSEGLVSYQPFKDGILIPTQYSEPQFRYDAAGHRILLGQRTAQVIRAQFNAPVSNTDLAFGDIPYGANVQDDRFTPPIRYYQGSKQFTDQKLIESYLSGKPVPGHPIEHPKKPMILPFQYN